jgi:hypothetical protein
MLRRTTTPVSTSGDEPGGGTWALTAAASRCRVGTRTGVKGAGAWTRFGRRALDICFPTCRTWAGGCAMVAGGVGVGGGGDGGGVGGVGDGGGGGTTGCGCGGGGGDAGGVTVRCAVVGGGSGFGIVVVTPAAVVVTPAARDPLTKT